MRIIPHCRYTAQSTQTPHQRGGETDRYVGAMGLRSCFTRAPSLVPSAPALPAPPPPASTEKVKSPKRGDRERRVRAPVETSSGPAAGFVPRSVAELHPEYAHSEPYHFAANTESCRMVVESAGIAARRMGDLRLRAQVVPEPPAPKRVIVRGPQYSARQKKLEDVGNSDQTSATTPAGSAPESPGSSELTRPKSNIKLIVERASTYAGKEEEYESDMENHDVNVNSSPAKKIKSPLFSRIVSKKSPRKADKSVKSSPAKKADKSLAVEAAIAHTRKGKEATVVKSIQFDNITGSDEEAAPESFTSNAPKSVSGELLKPIAIHQQSEHQELPAVNEKEVAVDDDGECNCGDENCWRQSADWREQSTFDTRDGVESSEDEHEQHERHYKHSYGDYSDSHHSDEEDIDGRELSRAEFHKQYPDATHTMSSQGASYESENDTEPSVSADGFLSEGPSASYTASVRSSMRSSVRSSMRSSMRSAADRFSVDSQYQQSMDGDRVASTFDFMRGSGLDSDSDEDDSGAINKLAAPASMKQVKAPRSPAGSFLSASSDDNNAPRRVPRREDSTLASPPRRHADKREQVFGNAEEPGSGRLVRRARNNRKTVSFRTEKPVVIEPNLRDRRVTPDRPLVSALRSKPKPPTTAELRDLPKAPPLSHGSSSANSSPNSSFGSLPNRDSRKSIRLAPEEVTRRRSMAVAEALAEQIRGVPRSAMLAYDEHNQSGSSSDEEYVDAQDDRMDIDSAFAHEDSSSGSWARLNQMPSRGSLRPRARSSRPLKLPPQINPGEVPEPPAPPPFAPAPTRVRSVRKAPPPPSAL